MFLSLLDPDPSINKQKMKKSLDFDLLFSDFLICLFYLWRLMYMNLQEVISKNIFLHFFFVLLASWKPLAKSGIRIRIRNQVCGSKDPYPDPGSVSKCHGSGTLVSWRRELNPTTVLKACFLFTHFPGWILNMYSTEWGNKLNLNEQTNLFKLFPTEVSVSINVKFSRKKLNVCVEDVHS